MKKSCSVLILLTILVTVFISSCEYSVNHITEDFFDGVSEIQLVYYDNPDSEIIERHLFAKKIEQLPFDSSKMEIIEVLSAEKQEEFLQLLVGMEFHGFPAEYDSPNGYYVRMLFENKESVIISAQKYGDFKRYDEGGAFCEHYGNLLITQDEIENYFDFDLP